MICDHQKDALWDKFSTGAPRLRTLPSKTGSSSFQTRWISCMGDAFVSGVAMLPMKRARTWWYARTRTAPEQRAVAGVDGRRETADMGGTDGRDDAMLGQIGGRALIV